MALLPQNQRDRKLLLVALAAVALGVVYQQMVWSPKNEELSGLQTHLNTLDSLNRLAKRDLAQGTTAKLKQEADAYGRELDVLHHLVPTENEVPALLEAISNAARRAGLELSDVQPDGVQNGDHFDTYRYRMGVTGPYHKIADFFANVGSLPRIVAPINVSLTPTMRVGEIKPLKDEQFLDAKFQIQTYVAHVALPAPTTSKAGAP